MDYRKILQSDLTIFPINLGGNVFGWTIDESESFALLDLFFSRGGNFIDTADTYSWWLNGIGGQSESIIGKWLKSRNNRQDVVIATKVGSQTAEHPIDISPKHILQSVDASLSRLQTDYIDIYYTHFDDGITPVEEILSTYQELIRAGKIRYIGASNMSAERLKESLVLSQSSNLPAYIALQPHYNLVERKSFEQIYRPLVEEYNLNVFPYYSLASGFLTGKYRTIEDFDKTARGGGIKHYLNEKNIQLLSVLDQIATDFQVELSTIALAWLLTQPTVTAPVVSATSSRQLEAILKAPTIQLTESQVNKLTNLTRP